MPVKAGWALWGKRPGASADYAILASSTRPLTKAEYGSIVTHFAPGNPPAKRGLPGSLPWVTFSQVGVAGRPFLGVSVQDSIGQVDAVGRPIAQTSYFCVPYADLAQPPVSCLALYQAVAGLTLPQQDGSEMELRIEPVDPAATAEIVRRLGTDAVATAAALLLEGPVTVTGAEGSTLQERLWFIDAVASLLPFAYRAGYTAATWAANGAGQRIRLAFSNRSHPGAAILQWQSTPVPIKTEGAARAYRHRLAVLLRRESASDPLTELIRSLAAMTEPARKFDQPQHALDSLREIDLPAVVLDAARNGTAKPDEIRQVFASGRITELPPGRRKQLLARLIVLGDQQDWEAVAQWFSPIAGEDAGDMLDAIATTCHKLLWSAKASPLVRQYLILAAHYGLEDKLLARLMIGPKTAEALRNGAGAAAALLSESVLAAPGSAAGYSLTQQAMKANPAVACQLLMQLAGSAGGAGPAITWLEPVLGDSLRPFVVVLGDPPGTVGWQALGVLAGMGVSWIRTLLQAASYGNRLDFALPGFTRWLAANAADKGPPDQTIRQYWRNTIGALTPRTVSARAWTDLALLITGSDPVSLLADLEDRPQFYASLVGAWEELAAEAEGADATMTATLAGYLSQRPWTASMELAADVTDLVGRLTEDGRRRQLEVVVARMLAATPGVTSWDFAARWLTGMDAARPGTAESLRYTAVDATQAEIAESCVQAARQGMHARDVGLALADSGAVGSGARAAAVLEALRRALPKTPMGPERVKRWQAVFVELFTGGAFGDRVAEEFPELTIVNAFNEIEYRLILLRVTASGGNPDVPPALSDAAVDELEKLRKFAGSIIRDAKKRSGRGPFRRGGKPSPAAQGART